MNEDEIARKLAEKTNPVPPPPTTTPETPPAEKPEDEKFHDNLPLENSVLKQQLLDYLQVPIESRHSTQVATWLETVLNWAASEAGSHDFVEVVRVIREQEQFAGTYLKPDRLMRLHQFIKIRQARLKLAAQEQALIYG
jgi:hypothetical protein